MTTRRLRKHFVTLHRRAAWVAGIALLGFLLSGLLHPLMTWTGPRAAAFFPPRATFEASHLAQAQRILGQLPQTQAHQVRITPSTNGPVLQVSSTMQSPRQYFSLDTGEALPDHDARHAEWLARYYSGLDDTPVAETTLQTEFSDDYPWVNRLLPVYRVRFARDDNLTLHIYTELNALASISNNYKHAVQTAFRWLHTWSWLDGNETARVVLMAALLGGILGAVIVGAALLKLLGQRTIPERNRRWHRRLACILVIPLSGFTASGLYHLLAYGHTDARKALQPAATAPLPSIVSSGISTPALNQPLYSVSLIQQAPGEWLWRLSIPVPDDTPSPTDSERYRGVMTEKMALYLDTAGTPQPDVTDEQVARAIATRSTGLNPDDILQVRQITHFGHDYDFRNKRLPVWQVSFGDARQTVVFVDPASGMQVDLNTAAQRREGLSFSVLHKWNPLAGPLGRGGRDLAVVATLLMALLLVGFGLRLSWARWRGRA